MSKSTGPILAIGGVTMANAVILHNRPIDWRVPIATAGVAAVFALAERGPVAPFVVGVAWLALVTTLFIPLDPTLPAPITAADQWWNNTGPAAGRSAGPLRSV